jgi:hypothetical protein
MHDARRLYACTPPRVSACGYAALPEPQSRLVGGHVPPHCQLAVPPDAAVQFERLHRAAAVMPDSSRIPFLLSSSGAS